MLRGMDGDWRKMAPERRIQGGFVQSATGSPVIAMGYRFVSPEVPFREQNEVVPRSGSPRLQLFWLKTGRYFFKKEGVLWPN